MHLLNIYSIIKLLSCEINKNHNIQAIQPSHRMEMHAECILNKRLFINISRDTIFLTTHIRTRAHQRAIQLASSTHGTKMRGTLMNIECKYWQYYYYYDRHFTYFHVLE